MRTLRLLLLLSLVSVGLCTICTSTNLGSSNYNLSHLASILPIQGYTVDFCNSIACVQPSNYLYNSFIVRTQNQQCQALTPGSQLSTTNMIQITNGLVLNYSIVTKADNSTVRAFVNITCSQANNKIVSATSNKWQEQIIYEFQMESPAGCYSNPDTQIWQYFRDKSIFFALVFWVIGLYSMFFGYFLLRVTVLVYGIVTAAGFSLIFFTFDYPQAHQSTSVLNWIMILSCIFGVFYGFFLITLPRFGCFNVGVWFGIIICLLLQNAALSYTNSMVPLYICFGVIGFICGVAGIMGFKYFIIVATAVISGYLLIRPLGFYLPYYPNEFNFYRESAKMPWQYYLYLLAILILALISIIFQSWLFKKRGNKDKLFDIQDDRDFKTKMRDLLQFKQVRDLINKGTDEFKLFKSMLKSKNSNNSQDYSRSSEVEEYQQKKDQNVGKYRPPSISDSVSSRSSDLSAEKSIEMVEIKNPPKKNTKANQRRNQ